METRGRKYRVRPSRGSVACVPCTPVHVVRVGLETCPRNQGLQRKQASRLSGGVDSVHEVVVQFVLF